MANSSQDKRYLKNDLYKIKKNKNERKKVAA